MTPSDRRLLSLILLSFAVLERFGELSGLALACVLLSVALGISSLSPKLIGPALPGSMKVGLLLVLGAVSILYDNKLPRGIFVGTFALLAVAILLHSLVERTAAKVVAYLIAATSVVAGIASNMAWGFADIDVFQFQQASSQALLHGQNPYSPIVRSPEMVPPGVPAWLQLHFPYGPILPVLEAPFRLLGDIRLLHIFAAIVTAGATLVLARRAGTLDRTVCVVMAFPLTAAMVLFSWVDIITMAGLAVWIVSFRTHPRIATVALVVVLAAKPTTLIALVPILFWSTRARRQMIIAGVIAAIFVLPFAAMTGFSQFYYNVLGVQLAVLPRLDSLTINSYLNALNLPILPFAMSAIIIGAATVLVLRRRPASYGDLLSGTAVLASVSFLVAKWAYLNYYYIPAVLLMLAIAGNTLPVDEPDLIRPPAVLQQGGEWLRAAVEHLRSGRHVPGAASIPREGELSA